MSIRNLAQIRKWTLPNIPDFGARLSETLRDLVNQDSIIAQQTNANPNGNPQAPPEIQNFTVQSHENGFDIAIQHDGEFYRGVNYFVDYADNPAFTGARTWHLGETRNSVLPLGNRALYFRAWAKYANSAATSPLVYGASSPQAVIGGKANPFLGTQGCGTSLPHEQPFHQPPYRSANGSPPVRT